MPPGQKDNMLVASRVGLDLVQYERDLSKSGNECEIEQASSVEEIINKLKSMHYKRVVVQDSILYVTPAEEMAYGDLLFCSIDRTREPPKVIVFSSIPDTGLTESLRRRPYTAAYVEDNISPEELADVILDYRREVDSSAPTAKDGALPVPRHIIHLKGEVS